MPELRSAEVNAAAIAAIADAVAERMRVPSVSPLWTLEEVAAFLQLEPRVVREKKIHEPGFPQPYRLPALRWNRDEVVSWLKSRRK